MVARVFRINPGQIWGENCLPEMKLFGFDSEKERNGA
jgi:hypothetical protein